MWTYWSEGTDSTQFMMCVSYWTVCIFQQERGARYRWSSCCPPHVRCEPLQLREQLCRSGGECCCEWSSQDAWCIHIAAWPHLCIQCTPSKETHPYVHLYPKHSDVFGWQEAAETRHAYWLWKMICWKGEQRSELKCTCALIQLQ